MTFSLKIVCVICREVLEHNGTPVHSETDHRVKVILADETCPGCAGPFVEACIRADSSQVVACAKFHTMRVRARVEAVKKH